MQACLRGWLAVTDLNPCARATAARAAALMMLAMMAMQ